MVGTWTFFSAAPSFHNSILLNCRVPTGCSSFRNITSSSTYPPWAGGYVFPRGPATVRPHHQPEHWHLVHKLAVVVKYLQDCYKSYKVGPEMPVKTAKSKFRLGHLAIIVLCACLSTFDTLHSQSSSIVRAVTTTELSHTKTNIEQVSIYDFNFIGKNKKKTHPNHPDCYAKITSSYGI